MTLPDIRTAFAVRGCVAFVSGGNRGIGEYFLQELARRGASKLYGGSRNPSAITEPGVVPVRLDVTDPQVVAAAAAQCPDVNLLINSHGVFRRLPLIAAPSEQDARAEMEINFWGNVRMIRAFAPVLAANGGGAIINNLSVLSFVNFAPWGGYSASKSAAWSLTNSARDELAGQGTLVVGAHASLVDTDMVKGIPYPMISREDYGNAALDALEAGHIEALADEHTRRFKTYLGDMPDNLASRRD